MIAILFSISYTHNTVKVNIQKKKCEFNFTLFIQLKTPTPKSSFCRSLPFLDAGILPKIQILRRQVHLTTGIHCFANSSSIYWVVPLPSTSHHGDPNTPSFASITGNGGQPKGCIMILSKPEKKTSLQFIFHAQNRPYSYPVS